MLNDLPVLIVDLVAVTTSFNCSRTKRMVENANIEYRGEVIVEQKTSLLVDRTFGYPLQALLND
jgi:hypothetical protein